MRQTLMLSYPKYETKYRVLSLVAAPSQFGQASKEVLAEVYVYGNENVWEGWLKVEHLNSQLAINADTYQAVINCLSGQKDRITISLEENAFKLSYQVKQGIDVQLFELPMKPNHSAPIEHMQTVFQKIQQHYEDAEHRQGEQRAKLLS